MSDTKRTLPPPVRRDVAGFGVKPGDAVPAEPEGTDQSGGMAVRDVESPTSGVAVAAAGEAAGQAPASGQPRRKPRTRRAKASNSEDADREKELRRRLIATLTPPTKELLNERARVTRSSFSDVLIEAWLSHGEVLEQEYQPDERLERRQKLGVRKPRHKRPAGRSDVQFYLTVRELGILEESATAAGYENRSAYIEELLIRELGAAEAAKQ